MGSILEALHRLQEIETALSKLRRGEDERNRQIRTHERQIRRFDDDIQQLDRQRSIIQTELDRYEQEVKSREDRIAEHREALLKTRTNKDYAAILTSINTEKADAAKVEKLALEKLAEIEQLQEQIDSRQSDREKAERRMVVAQKALQEHLDETADERQRLESDRDTAASDVPQTSLTTFSRVAERHEGEALCEVIRLHPRREEYVCGGCNMTMTLEVVNALRSRDEIQFCSVCGRILYLPSSAANKV